MGRSIRKSRSAADIEDQFARFLPRSLLTRASEKEGSRDRIFSRRRTFWLFLWQVLVPKTSCRAVVRKTQAEAENARRKIDESSSAYCQARARLSIDLFESALRHTAEYADKKAVDGVPGWSRPVKVVDASSAQVPDTTANAQSYHYPTGQKKGCRFPVLRFLALFSLASGVIHDITTAACYSGELTMLKVLWPRLKAGDILLGDRVFGCFPLLAALPLQDVDVVARLNQGRNLDLRRAPKLGHDDWLACFHKADVVPPYMTHKEWKKLPETILVRIIRSTISVKGFRSRTIWIVTTLTDAKRYSRESIVELYLRRWEMELTFRDVKTTMGMEVLRCLTPQMVEKELRMFLIAHNCIRSLMVEAAMKHNLRPQRISFKGTVDAVRSFMPALLRAVSRRTRNRLHSRLLEILAADELPFRPGRLEPRAVKRRPKPYPLLTAPRKVYKELPHKGNPRPHRRPQVILT